MITILVCVTLGVVGIVFLVYLWIKSRSSDKVGPE